jgi:hypothetical protein
MSGPAWGPTGTAASPAPLPVGSIVRTYKGRPDAAAAAFNLDAQRMAAAGWHPVSQSFAPERWSHATLVFAAILAVLLIGIFMLIYLVANKPPGVLTVVYEYRGDGVAEPPPPVQSQWGRA